MTKNDGLSLLHRNHTGKGDRPINISCFLLDIISNDSEYQVYDVEVFW